MWFIHLHRLLVIIPLRVTLHTHAQKTLTLELRDLVKVLMEVL